MLHASCSAVSGLTIPEAAFNLTACDQLVANDRDRREAFSESRSELRQSLAIGLDCGVGRGDLIPQ